MISDEYLWHDAAAVEAALTAEHDEHDSSNFLFLFLFLLTIPLLNKLLFSLREPQGALLC